MTDSGLVLECGCRECGLGKNDGIWRRFSSKYEVIFGKNGDIVYNAHHIVNM